MLREGTCPQLKELSVCHNHNVGDAGLRALVEAMQGGAPYNETLESLTVILAGRTARGFTWRRGIRDACREWRRTD